MGRQRTTGRDRGAALVELALILPIVAMLVFGTIDLVRAYRMNIRLEAAAREGAAWAQIAPNDVVCPGVYNDLLERIALEEPDLSSEPTLDVDLFYGPAPGPLTNEVDPPTCGSQSTDPAQSPVSDTDRVRVDVSAQFDILTPIAEIFTGDTLSLTSSAELEVQDST